MNLYVGKEVMVFDDKLFGKSGDSKSDSFYRKAVILKIDPRVWKNKSQLADVKFLHDNRVSKGHFSDMFKEIV